MKLSEEHKIGLVYRLKSLELDVELAAQKIRLAALMNLPKAVEQAKLLKRGLEHQLASLRASLETLQAGVPTASEPTEMDRLRLRVAELEAENLRLEREANDAYYGALAPEFW